APWCCGRLCTISKGKAITKPATLPGLRFPRITACESLGEPAKMRQGANGNGPPRREETDVSKHIDPALRGWDYEPGSVQARQVKGSDGRTVLQMRVDLGVLQLETAGRPDGKRPHGCATYFDYLRRRARAAAADDRPFQLDEDECLEADREF